MLFQANMAKIHLMLQNLQRLVLHQLWEDSRQQLYLPILHISKI